MKFSLICLFALACLKQCYAFTIEEASECVVFLQHQSLEMTVINGQAFEVWLKVPGTNVFFPKPNGFSGTGFLVSTGDTVYTTNTHLYLVTAKHVALGLGMTDQDLVVAHPDNDQAAIAPLSHLTGTNGWLHHEKADISVLPLEGDKVIKEFYGKAWIKPHFISLALLNAGTNCPDRNIPLTMIGFPLGIGAGLQASQFRPISRDTRAASVMMDDTFFLLQDPAIEGYSGSPLLTLGGLVINESAIAVSTTAFYGVVVSTFGDNTGGKMAQVVSIKCVLELISKFESKPPTGRK